MTNNQQSITEFHIQNNQQKTNKAKIKKQSNKLQGFFQLQSATQQTSIVRSTNFEYILIDLLALECFYVEKTQISKIKIKQNKKNKLKIICCGFFKKKQTLVSESSTLLLCESTFSE